MSRKRNPYAKALANPCFRKRIVKNIKGKGSYNRKQKGNKCQD
jgi:stalled ribosome alternative rescue factor ArfA